MGNISHAITNGVSSANRGFSQKELLSVIALIKAQVDGSVFIVVLQNGNQLSHCHGAPDLVNAVRIVGSMIY